MKIGITTFGCDLKSGMSRYVSSILTQFSSLQTNDQFDVIMHRSASSEYLAEIYGSSLKSVFVSESLSNPILNVAWHQTVLPSLAIASKYDVIFLPAASRRTPLWSPCPTVGTVHDLSPFHVTGKYDPARSFYQKHVLTRLLKNLTHIIAISECTKRDIQEFIGVPDEKISVIHHAADMNTFHPRGREASQLAAQRYGIRTPYIIYTSRIEHPGKNHIRLIKAYEMLRRENDIPHQLVLAGSDWHGADEVHRIASESPFSQDILLTGYVRGEDLPYLYSGADMLVFPSLFEGFGLPILEAMACGIPVACSNISSLPEIAGYAAVLFDPYDVESIADGMLAILSSAETHNRLSRHSLSRSAEFSWAKTAAQTLDVIHQVATK